MHTYHTYIHTCAYYTYTKSPTVHGEWETGEPGVVAGWGGINMVVDLRVYGRMLERGYLGVAPGFFPCAPPLFEQGGIHQDTQLFN